MEESISLMMAAAIEMVEPAVEAMGEPGQGIPVSRIVTGKGPLYRLPIEKIFNINVLGYIGSVVIVLDELKITHLAIEGEGRNQQKDRENECLPLPAKCYFALRHPEFLFKSSPAYVV